jgi:hypothetical protein
MVHILHNLGETTFYSKKGGFFMNLSKLFLAFSVVGSLVAANAAIIEFTNRAAWEAAVGNFSTETFDDAIFEDFTISAGYSGAKVQGGKWYDQINNPNQITTINFNSELTAIGGEWDLNGPGGPGSEIIFNLVGGETYTYTLHNSLKGDFFGIVSDVAFTGIKLTEGTLQAVETYTLDNLSYGSANVPEPAIISMFLLGIMSIAGLSFKRK